MKSKFSLLFVSAVMCASLLCSCGEKQSEPSNDTPKENENVTEVTEEISETITENVVETTTEIEGDTEEDLQYKQALDVVLGQLMVSVPDNLNLALSGKYYYKLSVMALQSANYPNATTDSSAGQYLFDPSTNMYNLFGANFNSRVRELNDVDNALSNYIQSNLSVLNEKYTSEYNEVMKMYNNYQELHSFVTSSANYTSNSYVAFSGMVSDNVNSVPSMDSMYSLRTKINDGNEIDMEDKAVMGQLYSVYYAAATYLNENNTNEANLQNIDDLRFIDSNILNNAAIQPTPQNQYGMRDISAISYTAPNGQVYSLP